MAVFICLNEDFIAVSPAWGDKDYVLLLMLEENIDGVSLEYQIGLQEENLFVYLVSGGEEGVHAPCGRVLLVQYVGKLNASVFRPESSLDVVSSVSNDNDPLPNSIL